VQQLNRFAELGQLSSGLFHDLLNLLNALSLRTDEEKDPSLESTFNTTKQIEGLMEAVRRQIRGAGKKELFSLPQAINHVIQLVNYQANRAHVRISFRHNASTDITHYDAPFKFQEIIINLLLNAIESYENISRSDIRARTIEINIKEEHCIATLRVADNGCGMTPEVHRRIFEPFFTTKENTKGIGIGLATIKKIIEDDLSGSITVQSEADKGSIFVVTFPIKTWRDIGG